MTVFSNDSYMDKPSEKFIFSLYKYSNDKRYKNNKKEILSKEWSLNYNEGNAEGKYITCFGMGYAKYYLDNEIYQECVQYIPIDDNLKVSILNLKNNLDEKVLLKIKYDLDFQIGESIEDKRFVIKAHKKSLNMNLFRNIKTKSDYVYVTSSEKINEYNEIEVNLEKEEEKRVVFIIGCEKNEMDSLSIGAKYIAKYEEELEKTKKYWELETGKIKSSTPVKTFDFMQNGLLLYQTIASRIFSKSGFYQASGGYGFRDQLQDCLALKYVDINYLREQILMCCKHQFFEGDVEHWWHEDTHLGVRSRFSDDLLWLAYATSEYISFTGDYSILNEEVMYLKADTLREEELDRVNIYNEYEGKGSVFEHCIKAINRVCFFGEHGLPLIKSGDWNDGMNRVGNKGKGESVWLGFFLYDILNKFIPLIDYMSKFAKKQIISKDLAISINANEESKDANANFLQDIDNFDYEELKENFNNNLQALKKALNEKAWDGRWYKRAFDDYGRDIGSINDEECKIDSIVQSWSVISGAGDNDKKYISLDSAEKYLIDNENNLIKLLSPALENKDLGYISSYAKGLRENGGQYTHAAIWILLAEILLGFNKKAFDIYKKINPIEHSLNKESADKYKVEPYVLEADICAGENFLGRGGWTWYTGSSSWLYKVQVENILGIQIKFGKMKISPCVPDDWDEFDVRFKYYDAVYDIKYKQRKIKKLLLNGKKVDEIVLMKKGKFNVEVYF